MLTGTTWVFEPPATPESQLTQTTALTQAQSQEAEGADSGTQNGSLPLHSPHNKTRRSSVPVALRESAGGATGKEEGGTQQGRQEDANDAPQSRIGPGKCFL